MYVSRSKCTRKAYFSHKPGTFHHVPNTNSEHCEFTLSLRLLREITTFIDEKCVQDIEKGTKNALTY